MNPRKKLTGGFLTGGFANLKTKKLALAWPQGPRSAPPAEYCVPEYQKEQKMVAQRSWPWNAFAVSFGTALPPPAVGFAASQAAPPSHFELNHVFKALNISSAMITPHD